MTPTRAKTWAVAAWIAALPWAASVADSERAEALYQLYCAQCHGVDGTGGGINARYMDTRPRDHTSRSEMGGRSDNELFRTIADGGQALNLSVMMPPWRGNLDDEDIEALVQYLRVLCCE